MLLYHETDRATRDKIDRDGFGDDHGSGATSPGVAWFTDAFDPERSLASHRGWLLVVDVEHAEAYLHRFEDGEPYPGNYQVPHEVLNRLRPFTWEPVHRA